MSIRFFSRTAPALALASFGVLALGAACGGSALTETATISGIALTPPNATMTVGSTLSLDAAVQGSASPTGVFWSSSDTTIAIVTSSGVVTARRAGRANIAATALGNSAVASITVNSAAISPPALPPAPPTPPTPAPALAAVATVAVNVTTSIDVGETAQATATLRSASGATLTGRSVSWSSSNVTVATVSASGLVSAKKQGNVTITATSEGKQGSRVIAIRKD